MYNILTKISSHVTSLYEQKNSHQNKVTKLKDHLSVIRLPKLREPLQQNVLQAS